MDILVLNCGSSSLKYQLIDMSNEKLVAKGNIERIGLEGSNLFGKGKGGQDITIKKSIANHVEAAGLMFKTLLDEKIGVIKSLDEIGAIGHRVLHGVNKFKDSVLVDNEVKEVLRDNFDLGPLHIPANLMGIEACETDVPGKKNVAVFDTTFGMDMEEKAYLYAIPREYYEKYQIRRYGFHGTSHKYVANETIKFGNLGKDAKVITCHLGGGSSVAASIGGKCVDTSMGFTPLEGLAMGTRSGNIDPSIIQFLMKKENLNVNQVMEILNKKSGMVGLYGKSDFRDLKEGMSNGDKNAKTALDVFFYRIAKYIGSYIVALQGCDAITFTAGMGENQELCRKGICDYLGVFGVKLDPDRFLTHGEPQLLSTDDSKIKVFMIPTNEELMIARETIRIINK